MDIFVCDRQHRGDASKRSDEKYQTMARLAKNDLHPGFPWRTATEILQTARGHPGRARGRLVGPQRTGISAPSQGLVGL